MGGRLCTGRAIEGVNTAASNEDAFFLAAGENDWKSARLALTKAKKKAQLESVRALALDTEPVMFAFAKAHLMGLKGHFDENFDFVKNELFSGDADISHYKGAMVHALLSNLDPEKLVSDAADRETVVMLSEAQANGAGMSSFSIVFINFFFLKCMTLYSNMICHLSCCALFSTPEW